MAGTYHTTDLLWGRNLQWWAFLLLFIGFAIKVPAVPVHTWLPDAHVEAPTPISMILAGVLLKMGGYGIIRICYPICPDGGYQLMYFVCGIGVVSMIYGAFAAMAQKDFKRLVAYSSVSHMGYVVLGLGVWRRTANHLYDPYYWSLGVNGAMFQMIAHGISSAGMFFMVGVIYDRVHHRNLDQFGGLFAKMPRYSGLAIGLFFAGLGLPGLCGFIGEVLVTLSTWNFSHTLAVLSAAVVILTASYILWTITRLPGPRVQGPAWRPSHAAHEPRVGDRRAAVGVCDPVRRLSASDFQHPDSERESVGGAIGRLDEDCEAAGAEPSGGNGGRAATPRSQSLPGSAPPQLRLVNGSAIALPPVQQGGTSPAALQGRAREGDSSGLESPIPSLQPRSPSPFPLALFPSPP